MPLLNDALSYSSLITCSAVLSRVTTHWFRAKLYIMVFGEVRLGFPGLDYFPQSHTAATGTGII